MGGGASAIQGVDEMLSTTYMIGRAISAITFPGMYRIYDFHSDKAPKLKNQKQFTFFALDSDDEDDESDTIPDESSYSHLFSVTVGEDRIYLEDPLEVNDAGWTPLHTCCMSFLSVPAGLTLIAETVKRGGSVDLKTIAGPGTFNSEWTPLQMACAYGIGQIVERLLEEGANVNTTNCFGYTPLLEACHRGFLNIVEVLIKAGANLTYIPSDEASYSSPFVSAPAQAPLAESARCGFVKIVQTLLDAGAPKDHRNSLGWTALHEACFYNRIEVVKVLMLGGANASLRTRGGALPYHLAGLQIVRTMLQDMGGSEVVPEVGDTIDMVAILRELTMSDVYYDENNRVCTTIISVDERSGTASLMITNDSRISPQNSQNGQKIQNENSSPKNNKSYPLLDDDKTVEKAEKARTEMKRTPMKEIKTNHLLHSGGVLGDLPSLQGDNRNKIHASGSSSNDISRALDYGIASSEFPTNSGSPDKHLDSRADGKDKNYSSNTISSSNHKLRGKKKQDMYAPPAGFPPSFLCQLSQRPMTEPVKSVYGNVFDKSVILRWMGKQGHICPISGAPLSESDLKPMEEMGQEIRSWILEHNQVRAGVEVSTDPSRTGGGGGGGGEIKSSSNSRNLASPSSIGAKGGYPSDAVDDLYEF